VKILQIYNHIPKELEMCIKSVKDYAKRADAEYLLIDKDPDPSFAFKTAWADIIRNEICSQNEYLLYVDWDIILSENFHVSGDIALFGVKHFDSIMWTGKQTYLWKKWKAKYDDYAKNVQTVKQEYCRIQKDMFKDDAIKNIIDINSYNHLKFTGKK